MATAHNQHVAAQARGRDLVTKARQVPETDPLLRSFQRMHAGVRACRYPPVSPCMHLCARLIKDGAKSTA